MFVFDSLVYDACVCLIFVAVWVYLAVLIVLPVFGVVILLAITCGVV